MTKNELKQRLVAENVPDDAYCLEGGLPNDRTCLAHNSKNKWEVYYSERGGKMNLKVFDIESAACDYFYEWLMDDLRFDKKNKGN